MQTACTEYKKRRNNLNNPFNNNHLKIIVDVYC